MWELEIKNLKNGVLFTKTFYNERLKNNFIKKCSYSKKIKVIRVLNYSHLYD